MNIIHNSILFAGIILYGLHAAAQADTSRAGHLHSDSSDWFIENPLVKNKFLGNAFYITGSFNLARVHEWDINAGRGYMKTYISGGPFVVISSTWGAGFGRTTRKGQAQNMLKAFYEYSLFVFPPYAFTCRGDYIFLPSARQHYLRPSFGLNLLVLDLLYNYSFKLNGSDNLFKHGFTMRLKKFTNSRKWEKHKARNC